MKKEVLVIFGDIDLTSNECIVHHIDNVMLLPMKIALEVSDSILGEHPEWDNYIIPEFTIKPLKFVSK